MRSEKGGEVQVRENQLVDIRTGKPLEPREWADGRRGFFWHVRRLLGFEVRTTRKERRRQDRKEAT